MNLGQAFVHVSVSTQKASVLLHGSPYWLFLVQRPPRLDLRSVQSRHFLALLLVYLRGLILCFFSLAASVLLPPGGERRQAIGDTRGVLDGSLGHRGDTVAKSPSLGLPCLPVWATHRCPSKHSSASARMSLNCHQPGGLNPSSCSELGTRVDIKPALPPPGSPLMQMNWEMELCDPS